MFMFMFMCMFMFMFMFMLMLMFILMFVFVFMFMFMFMLSINNPPLIPYAKHPLEISPVCFFLSSRLFNSQSNSHFNRVTRASRPSMCASSDLARAMVR